MNNRLNLLQLAVDEVYENPQKHEDLLVNLLIHYFTVKKEPQLKDWVDNNVEKEVQRRAA